MSAAKINLRVGTYISFTSRFEKGNCSVVSNTIGIFFTGGRGLLKGGNYYATADALQSRIAEYVYTEQALKMVECEALANVVMTAQ